MLTKSIVFRLSVKIRALLIYLYRCVLSRIGSFRVINMIRCMDSSRSCLVFVIYSGRLDAVEGPCTFEHLLPPSLAPARYCGARRVHHRPNTFTHSFDVFQDLSPVVNDVLLVARLPADLVEVRQDRVKVMHELQG